jgi:hypothetical protein
MISLKQVLVWCNQFKEGRASLLDEERAGRPTTAYNAVSERRVEQLLLTDRRMKLKEIAYTHCQENVLSLIKKCKMKQGTVLPTWTQIFMQKVLRN